jgi:hypothetical protein
VCPMSLGPHLIGCPHRKWNLTHQFRRNFVHDIYGLANTFHQSNSKVLSSNVHPFLQEIPFGPSKFGSKQGYPLDEGIWELQSEGFGHEEWSQPPMLICMPTTN